MNPHDQDVIDGINECKKFGDSDNYNAIPMAKFQKYMQTKHNVDKYEIAIWVARASVNNICLTFVPNTRRYIDFIEEYQK